MSILAISPMCMPVGNGFIKALNKVFDEVYELPSGGENFNQRVIDMVMQHRPTITWLQIQADNVLHPDTVKEIAQHTFCIGWSGDVRGALEGYYIEWAKAGQHITCFSNMRDVKMIRNIGFKSEWMECGVDEQIYRPYSEPVQYDVIAHMNDYGNLFELGQLRRDIVATLRHEFGDRFCVFGNFPGGCDNFNNSQPAEARNYARARVALNVSHYKIEKYSSDRLGRIMLCAGPLCVSHEFPGIEEMYTPGKHLVTFSGLSDMVSKIRYYLEHEGERQEIVRTGYDRALEIHTFSIMAQQIKSLYEKWKQT